MHRKSLVIPLLLLASAAAARTAGGDGPTPDTETADTVIVVDKVQVTAIKQGLVLRSQPVAASIVGGRAIERGRIGAVKNLSQTVPNFHAPDYGSRMTSSIYVRGLGARIDQPVIGLNIDNVPVLNKDNFDTELADAERIEVLRGPQSTLYGRNTMGGVVNVYTLSPLTYEGVRLTAEYGSGDSYRFRASSYYKLSPDLGMAVTGYFTHTGGFFDNDCTGEKCDWERLGGGRWKTQWRNNRGVRIDNTFSFSALDQGGYPYAYAGEDIVRDGKTVIRNGQISYNDPSSYRRTTVSDGLTVRYDAAKYSVSSITSYQYSDDEMTLDQDFTPEPWFTLRQARREHALTEDIVFRSHDGRRYGWLLGAFGFYRHGVMEAPVHFKRTGIEELIVKNANEHLAQNAGRLGREFAALEELAQLLGLPQAPEYIESYDISHTFGADNVAGMVVFHNGRPMKKAYKKFAIKGFDGQNDVGSMQEVLQRRFTHYREDPEDSTFKILPDLILLDGGDAQVHAVLPVLAGMHIDVPVFGMVKDSKHRTRAISTGGGEIQINANRQSFTLVSSIQEEVHRFAVSYHHQKHKKSAFNSTLLQIEGIGPAKAKALLKTLKTVTAVREATQEQLAAVPGISRENAKAVYAYYHGETTAK